MRTLGIIVLILQLALPAQLWAAAITSAGSGNWNSTTPNAPWPSGVLPIVGTDTVTIRNADTVTITDTRSIPATTSEGTLTQGPGITTTLAGTLTIGNGTGKTGTFTFGSGSTLDTNGNTFALNNCYLLSNSTSNSWAKVVGTGAVAVGGANGGVSSQVVNLQYVSFLNTGALRFYLGSTPGSLVSDLNLSNVVFDGPSSITLGSSFAPLGTKMKVLNSDFFNANVTMVATTGTATTTDVYFDHCLFWKTDNTVNAAVLDFQRRIGPVIRNSVILNYQVTASDTKIPPITNSLIAFSATNSAISAIVGANRGESVFTGNVGLLLGGAHFWGSTDATLTPPHIVTDNYMETSGGAFELLIPDAKGLTITGNVIVGKNGTSGVDFNKTDNVQTLVGTWTIKNNTIIAKPGPAINQGLLLYSGHGVAKADTGYNISLANNLLVPTSGSFDASDAVIYTNTVLNPAMSWYVDNYNNNNEYNVVTRKTANVTIVNESNNINVPPNFLDPAFRDISAYYVHKVGGTFNNANLWAELSKTNGYNSVNKDQSATPTAITYSDAYSWIRSGYTPTNMTLATAGEGGTYIGAVQPVAATPPSIWQRIFKSRIFH